MSGFAIVNGKKREAIQFQLSEPITLTNSDTAAQIFQQS